MKRVFSWKIVLPMAAVAAAAGLVMTFGRPRATARDNGRNTLRIASPYSLGTLNPLRYMADYDFQIISQIYEPLITFDPAGQAAPALASSWRVSNDGLVWTFELRDDARWPGGNDVFQTPARVSAHDVVTTLQLVLDPANGATFQSQLAPVLLDAQAPDDRTVRITTRAPYAFLLDLLGHIPIVSARAVQLYGVEGLADHPVGSGPFRLLSLGGDGTVTLVPNAVYPQRPGVDRVVFLAIADKNVAATALENGEIDVALQLPPQEAARLSGSSSIRVVQSPIGSYRYAALNERRPPFDDVRMRAAIAQAIDIEAAVKAIFPDPRFGRAAWGPVPPGIPGYDPDLNSRWGYDQPAARRALEALGWSDVDGDGLLEKDGRRLTLTIYAPNNDDDRRKLAVIIAGQLRAVGIAAGTKIQEWGVHLADVEAGRDDMAIMGGGGSIDGLLYLFHSQYVTPDHDTGYRDAKLDALLDEAVSCTDERQRIELWREAQRIVVDDRVHVAGYIEFINAGVSGRVRGFVPPGYTLLLDAGGINVSMGGDGR